MKKFIFVISNQNIEDWDKKECVYKAVDCPRLENNIPTNFPIIAVMSKFWNKGEDIKIIAIKQNNPNCEKNLEYFKKSLTDKFGIKNPDNIIDLVEIEDTEFSSAHLYTFKEIIKRIDDGDTLYVDITYGTKPIPMIQMMVLNYVNQYKTNVLIESVCYGKFYHNEMRAELYDVTSLFYMNGIVNALSKIDAENPVEIIETLLSKED